VINGRTWPETPMQQPTPTLPKHLCAVAKIEDSKVYVNGYELPAVCAVKYEANTDIVGLLTVTMRVDTKSFTLSDRK